MQEPEDDDDDIEEDDIEEGVEEEGLPSSSEDDCDEYCRYGSARKTYAYS